MLDLSIMLLCTVDATFKCQTRKLTYIHIAMYDIVENIYDVFLKN